MVGCVLQGAAETSPRPVQFPVWPATYPYVDLSLNLSGLHTVTKD